jgi:ABC-type sugar transport system ATPase subunit
LDKVILQISRLNKTYSGIRVLKDIDFHLIEGEVHALVGENGAGKTTLIKIIAGVEKPDDGAQIIFEGEPVHRLTPAKSIMMGISVIYQDISLFPNLSIAENICIGGLKGRIVNWGRIRATAGEALQKIGSTDINPDAILGEISIGKQQIVALARAVTLKSKIIVMDEPTAALSSSEVNLLYGVIKKLKKDNVSIIYISHKIDEVFKIADRISILRDGEMVATKPANEFDNQSLVSMMVGRELRFSTMRHEGDAGEKIFEVKGLAKEPLFKDISFSLYKNEILGITGLVGARKSEMAQTLFGLLKADKGTVIMEGKEIVIKSAAQAISKGICYLPEDRRSQGLFMKHNMSKNITASSLQKILNKFKLISAKKELSTTESYIDKLNIKPRTPDIKAENMSGGNQQKVLISRWLNAGPKLLITDEATSGVDIGAKAEIHRFLRELAKSGVGVILISSDLPEVLAISDRILIMRDGWIVEVVRADATTQEDVIKKGLMG